MLFVQDAQEAQKSEEDMINLKNITVHKNTFVIIENINNK